MELATTVDVLSQQHSLISDTYPVNCNY